MRISSDDERTFNSTANNASLQKAKEKSVLLSLIIDFVLLIPDIVAALLANSITLLADVLKCINELLATFFSWIILRRISKGKSFLYEYGMGKFENIAGLFVSVLMILSFMLVIIGAYSRIHIPEDMNEFGVKLGIILMTIGVAANTYLSLKNYKISKKEYSPIMESQWRLFRVKAFADGTVLISLVVSEIYRESSWNDYIDPITSILIGFLLLYSAYKILTNSVYDLLDKTVEESVQIAINKELVAFFHEYENFHGVRSRRAGNKIFIEIFLEFNPERKMGEVQKSINHIKKSLEEKIIGGNVSVIPTKKL